MGLKSVLIVTLALVACFTCNAQKTRLRVVSILDSPYLMQGDDGDSDKYEGFCEDLAELLSEELGVEHEIHLVNDGKYGAKNASGQWVGMIGELLNNEADIAIAPLTITAARSEVVDFSTPFQDFQLSILMKKPTADEEDESDETLTIFAPFDLYLWLGILFSLLGLIFISLVVEWSFKSPETHGEGFINFLRQDSIFRPESITGKIIRFVYLVFIVIVIAAYTASFAVQREVDSQPPVLDIDSVEDLIKEDDMHYAIIAGGSTSAYLKSSNDPIYKTLYDTIDREQTAVSSYSEGLAKLRQDDEEEGDFAFLIESPKAEYFMSQEPCDLITAEEEFGPSRGYGIATPKNSPYSAPVNVAILKLKENGKLEQLIKKFWNDLECSDSEDNGDSDDDDSVDEDDFDALHLTEMVGLFYFLLAGFILIILVWILERKAISK